MDDIRDQQSRRTSKHLQNVRDELAIVMAFKEAFEEIRPLDGKKKKELDGMIYEILWRTFPRNDT